MPLAIRTRARRVPDGAFGDGLALSLTAGIGAAVGMASWLYVARTLDPAEVGRASAFVSAFQVVAGCTEVNLGIALLRWLPHAGRHTRNLLVRCALTVVLLAAGVGGLVLLLPGAGGVVSAVAEVGGPVVAGAVLVLACVAWALYQQQDYVLVGLRRPWWCPGRAVLYAVSRVVVLVVAGGATSAAVVVGSWLVPVAVCVVAAAVATVLWTRRPPPAVGTEHLPRRRDVVAFLGPTYAGQIGVTLLAGLVPLLVTVTVGPAPGAAFFLMWQGVTVVDVVAQYFVASVAGAVSRDPEHGREHSRASRRRLLWLMLPALAVAALVAHPVLALFGPEYASHAAVFRVLLLGVALRLWVIHRLAEYQAFGRGGRYAALSLTSAGLVALGAALAPGIATTAGLDPLVLVAGCYVAVHLGCVIATRRPSELPST
ncbi:lipopolysaccharide biosynthesis protein [Actinomycetospora chiangmaiensis]|uniref:lipopolysaccharide biosynthesis protein n=1 Tax=Actinomycetospora chiangmaiensis TaxID=402650 RepID=UPI00037302EF|nr:hypothetical protein [Actinomycetospora chiangmaiensis]